jgi:hypothetical protein
MRRLFRLLSGPDYGDCSIELRLNKVVADPKHGSLRKVVEQIAEAALDQLHVGDLMHDDTIAPNADVATPKSSALDGSAGSQHRAV